MTAAIDYCRALVQIDTSNPGSSEDNAAAFISDLLQRSGVSCQALLAEGRCSLVATHPGSRADLPGLVVHCHLDAVPVGEEPWSIDPFGAEIRNGFLYGRGAADVKYLAGMMVAAQLEMARHNLRPRRRVMFVYFADEEAGGVLGSQWLVREHADLFSGFSTAIGELGGLRVLGDGFHLYPVHCAERGTLWLRVVLPGRHGHSALSQGPTAITRAADFIKNIQSLSSAIQAAEAPAAAHSELEARLSSLLKLDAGRTLASLGPFGLWAQQGAHTAIQATVVHAGSKINVQPERAEILLDCRFVPGAYPAVLHSVQELLSADMTCEVLSYSPAAEAPVADPILRSMEDAVRSVDPTGIVIPYCLPAGTDGQRLAELGISSYGFAPLPLDNQFNFFSQLHSTDEHVPVKAIEDGYQMLRHFILHY